MHDSGPAPTPKFPAAAPPPEPRRTVFFRTGLRRTGLVGTLVLGLAGVLPGAAAAPATASEIFPAGGPGQQTQPDGRGGNDGDGRGGGKGNGGGSDGRGHGKGQGHGHGHGHGNGNGNGNGRTVDYVAFGDSYAAGVGGGPAMDTCGRTAEGYPALLDALPRVELDSNQSCGGATALPTPPPPPAGAVDLPEQISAAVAANLLTERTDMVTVTISGNDVQFGSVVAACAGPVLPATCAPAIAAAQAYAEAAVAPQLQASFAAVRNAAPRAELVVTGYPHLFEGTTPGVLSIEAQQLFSAGTDALNALLAAQVGDGTFVDVTDEFAGHGIGSADPWIILEGGLTDLHPNAAGYRGGYFAAITETVDLLDRDRHGRGGCRGR